MPRQTKHCSLNYLHRTSEEFPTESAVIEPWVFTECGINYFYTRCFIMLFVITNIYNKKTKGPTLIELFTATRKLDTFLTTRDIRCVHRG
jgi:hypothetical protein